MIFGSPAGFPGKSQSYSEVLHPSPPALGGGGNTGLSFGRQISVCMLAKTFPKEPSFGGGMTDLETCWAPPETLQGKLVSPLAHHSLSLEVVPWRQQQGRKTLPSRSVCVFLNGTPFP